MTEFSPKKLSRLVLELREFGSEVPSERGDTFEFENEILTLGNPRDRICTETWRKMNIGFAIVDALSHIVGDSNLSPLTQFVPGFTRFSTNGKTIDGAYGIRINSGNQLQLVIEMLKRDPNTRRAVISIYMGVVDLNGGGGLNTPCTLNFHFLVRKGRLNMKVMMRSNDVYLGLTNDVFTFTMLQEYVSAHTGIPLGTYTHFASSFHLYKSDAEKIKLEPQDGHWPDVMGKMPNNFDPTLVYSYLCKLNKTTVEDCLVGAMMLPTQYEKNLFLASAVVYHRKAENVLALLHEVDDATLKRVAEFWVTK